MKTGAKPNHVANKCFDHLGGKLAVEVMKAFLKNGWIKNKEGRVTIFEITEEGMVQLEKIGVDVSQLYESL